MTVSLSELMNRQVIASSTGERLGVVKDAMIDVGQRTVAALVLSGSRGESILPFEKVRTFGQDAVMIDSASDVSESASGPVNARRFNEIAKVQALTTGGVALGTLDSFTFNGMSGGIEVFEVAEGGVFGIGAKKQRFPASAVKGIGPDAVTIEPEATA